MSVVIDLKALKSALGKPCFRCGREAVYLIHFQPGPDEPTETAWDALSCDPCWVAFKVASKSADLSAPGGRRGPV